MNIQFNDEVTKELKQFKNFNVYSLNDVVSQWSKFVDSCTVNGYGDYLVEYDNDIAIRSVIVKPYDI